MGYDPTIFESLATHGYSIQQLWFRLVLGPAVKDLPQRRRVEPLGVSLYL